MATTRRTTRTVRLPRGSSVRITQVVTTQTRTVRVPVRIKRTR